MTALLLAIGGIGTAHAYFSDRAEDYAAGYTGEIGVQIPSILVKDQAGTTVSNGVLTHGVPYELEFTVRNDGNVRWTGNIDLFGYFASQGLDLSETGIIRAYPGDADPAAIEDGSYTGPVVFGPNQEDSVAMPASDPATTGLLAADVETGQTLEPGANKTYSYWVVVLPNDAETAICTNESIVEGVRVCEQTVIFGARARAHGTTVTGQDTAWSGADRKQDSAIAQIRLSTKPQIERVDNVDLAPFVGQVNADYLATLFTAYDEEDGDITDQITITPDAFDPFAVGTVDATANVSDSTGTAADPKTRTLEVWNLVDIDVGDDNTVALDSLGRVWAWGNDAYGKSSGDGSSSNVRIPTLVQGLPEGSVAVDIETNYGTSYAVLDDGRVFAWGYNGNGAIGDGTTTSRYRPVQVNFPAGTQIVEVESFDQTAVARDTAGNVYSWGDGSYGTIGDGTTTRRTTPVQLEGVTGATDIASGQWNGAAIVGGQVYVWGSNWYGQMGDGDTDTSSHKPQLIPGLNNVVSVASGWDYLLAATADGTVYGWGEDDYAKATGDGGNSTQTTPTAIEGLPGGAVKEVVTGEQSSLVLYENGQVWGWGQNTYNQLLSDGGLIEYRPVQSLASDATTADVYMSHSMWLTMDGSSVKGFGLGGSYRLGNNSTSSHTGGTAAEITKDNLYNDPAPEGVGP